MLTWTPASRPAKAAQVLASLRRVVRYLRMLMVLLLVATKKRAGRRPAREGIEDWPGQP
jgi:hypothetical protein